MAEANLHKDLELSSSSSNSDSSSDSSSEKENIYKCSMHFYCSTIKRGPKNPKKGTQRGPNFEQKGTKRGSKRRKRGSNKNTKCLIDARFPILRGSHIYGSTGSEPPNPWIPSAMAMAMSIYRTLCVLVYKQIIRIGGQRLP